MRRWAAGTDRIPDGVWRDIHWHHAEARWRAVQHFDEAIVARLSQEQLLPRPNTRPMSSHLGLHFALHTEKGRTVRYKIVRRNYWRFTISLLSERV